MTTLNPWINFNGNAEEAFHFYKSVFGAELGNIIRFKDIAGPEFSVPKEEEEKITQIMLPLGNGQMLVGNDVPSFLGKVSESENRSKIYIGVESKGEADKLFAGLSEGGQVEGPIGESPWGTYSAALRDKYGIEWIIEYQEAK